MSPRKNKARGLLGHTINIRLILFLAFALLVVFISVTILAASFIQTSRLANEASSALIDRTHRQADAELRRLLDPIMRQVAVSHQWLKNGLVKRYDTDALMELFLPGMFQLPQCVSMMVSDMTGYELTIFRNESGRQLEIPERRMKWTTRDFRREEWGKMAKWILWDENGRERIKQWQRPAVWTVEDVLKHRPSGTSPDEIKPEDLIYDPRVRCWHEGPRDRYREKTEIVRDPKEAIYWTEVDFFFTSKAPGITAGIAAKVPEGDLVVVAYDLLLRDMSDFTRELQPSKHGKVFVFSQTGKLVGLPRDKRFQDKNLRVEAILKPVEDAGIPELKSCMKFWRHRESDYPPIFQFKSRGQVWYASFRPFPISVERSLWTGVAIPQSDLLATARRSRIIILAVGLTALVLGILIAVLMSRSFSKPLNVLVNQSNRIADLDLEPGSHVESRYAEFKQLSDSLEVTRTSLVDYITKRKQTEEALHRSEAELRRLSSHLLKAQEEERKRIARELHDGIGQSLSAIKFKVETALNEMGQENPGQVVKSLEAVVPVAQEAVEEVRRISRNLRPSILDDLGILATISWMCREVETIYSGIRIEKQIDIEEHDMPDSLKIIIYRVLQESFNNIAKHSQATLVRLSLKGADGKVELAIDDNGMGFDVEQVLSGEQSKRGIGLAGMKERTELSGGSFSVESHKGAGTTVRASWPCD